MANLITCDYCVSCPYFEVRVHGCDTPKEFIDAMNREGTQTSCKYENMCDRIYQYVRKKCKEASL